MPVMLPVPQPGVATFEPAQLNKLSNEWGGNDSNSTLLSLPPTENHGLELFWDAEGGVYVNETDESEQLEERLDGILSVSSQGNWFPYDSKVMFILDLMNNLPRL
ncbi:hypothetical protein M422DRAFT_254435 [Sphaerobolus stellatus SS14]|uniref:Uncharacterized protein n=1 Tax=Sphaerobolus stellatus (strain SS14) TaxID=990650 RepID=A0A0C9VUY2_SPHS4|nr:hypothetical protein M422DRAFT_254435 [Sphaerobolus stellatus SS14]